MGRIVLIERIPPEEEAKLQELARAVAADLRFIGLHVEEAGDSWTGYKDKVRGFVVYYDPSARLGETGVYVKWKPSAELLRAAAEKEAGTHTRITDMMIGSIDALAEALRKILEASGWQVHSEEWNEPALKVSRQLGRSEASAS
jgi:hypothetical protein